MQLKCIAIDDEPLALNLIREYVSNFPSLKLMQTFDDAIAGIEFLKNNAVDLLFVDINMPDITGIDLVRSLPKKPVIIFTTAYKKFAIDGFELDAVDYLLKPIAFDRFERAVNKAINQYQFNASQKTIKEEPLFVRSEYQLVKIDLNEIEYIESVEDYLKIHRTIGRPIMTLMTLKAILEKLPAKQFKRIHRSYIVPLSKVRSFVNRKVKLTNVELPVSDSYIDSLSEWVKK
jgi:two-component system, LytTR family, response regulator